MYRLCAFQTHRPPILIAGASTGDALRSDPLGGLSGHGPGIQKSVSTEHLDRHPPHSTTTDLGIAKGIAVHDRAEAPKGPKRRRLAAPGAIV